MPQEGTQMSELLCISSVKKGGKEGEYSRRSSKRQCAQICVQYAQGRVQWKGRGGSRQMKKHLTKLKGGEKIGGNGWLDLSPCAGSSLA